MGKMHYPKGRMVVVRECTVGICNHNNPASVLLSTLLFWYDNPRSGDAYNEEAQTFTACRTQAELAQQACHQIDVKTIHDTAVPFLLLFGYLTIKEKMNGNLYILHIDRIETAYAAYESGVQFLHDFLKASLQLETAPIHIPEDELESVLTDKRRLYSQLARVLIANRADSHCKRGRKPKLKAISSAESPNTENNREFKRISTEREENHSSPRSSDIFEGISDKKESSFAFSPNEQTLLAWITEQQYEPSITQQTYAKIKEQVEAIVPFIKTPNDLKHLCAFCVPKIPGEDKTVYLGNMVKWVKAWTKTEAKLDNAQNPQENAFFETMNKGQAEAFAMSLLSTFPAELLGIDQPYGATRDIWTTCVQYAEGEWLPFSSPEHYRNPSAWERERLAEAMKYGQAFACQQLVV